MFTVIGEALLDMVQREPGAGYVAWPGGGPFNIGVGLRRLGHPTALMARLSTGGLGGVVRDHATGAELDLSASVDTADQTTLAFATLDDEGRASYDFYVNGTADWGWSDDELHDLPASTKVVHTGSLAAAIAPGADRILARLQRVHAEGSVLVSFDPNVRPALAGPHGTAVARAERFVAVSHVVKASDEDLGWLYPGREPDDVLRHWAALGPELVVMTRGAEGCVAVKADQEPLWIPGRTVRVVDTIGAGDAFESGLLSGLVDAGCRAPGDVRRLARDHVRSALERAVVVSGLTCERAGADPPTRAEYDAVGV